MVTIASVQNKIFSGNRKELTKVSQAVSQAESQLYGQFPGIRQSLWRFVLESLYIYASPFRNKWYCRAGRTKGGERNIRGTSAIWFGWKVVGWSHGMLLQSAKRSRPLVGREHTSRTAFWRNILWASNSCWIDDWISSYFCKKASRYFTSYVWNFYLEYSSGNLERRHFGRTRQESMLEDSMQKNW